MTAPIIVIGGGPAGIQAAKAAAVAGGPVTLVSEGPVGGRAGWHSLLPSKVWLAAADSIGLLSALPGLHGVEPRRGHANATAILAHISAVKETWNKAQRAELEGLGVEILTGVAAFESINRVVIKDGDGQVVDRRIGEAIIVASGSVPFFPPNLRPDGQRVLAPRFASSLDTLPDSVVVIGAGATGCEFTYLFNRLGAEVTWVIDEFGVLPAFAPQAGRFLAQAMAERGVRLVRDHLAERIEREADGVAVVTSDGERLLGQIAFVAIGRTPDLDRLNLGAIGLEGGPGKAPSIDEFGRTDVSSVYIAGDAAGPPMVANRAMAQAWIAGRHAAGVYAPPFRPDTVIQAIYTEPQVAQVGTVEGDGLDSVHASFASGLKAHLIPEGEGFVELAYDGERRVAGGLAVGPHAADALAPVALAIQVGGSLDDMAVIYSAHPTVSEMAFMVARLA